MLGLATIWQEEILVEANTLLKSNPMRSENSGIKVCVDYRTQNVLQWKRISNRRWKLYRIDLDAEFKVGAIEHHSRWTMDAILYTYLYFLEGNIKMWKASIYREFMLLSRNVISWKGGGKQSFKSWWGKTRTNVTTYWWQSMWTLCASYRGKIPQFFQITSKF